MAVSFRAFCEDLRGLAKELNTRFQAERVPSRLSGSRSRDYSRDIGGRGYRNLTDDFAGGGVVGLQRFHAHLAKV